MDKDELLEKIRLSTEKSMESFNFSYKEHREKIEEYFTKALDNLKSKGDIGKYSLNYDEEKDNFYFYFHIPAENIKFENVPSVLMKRWIDKNTIDEGFELGESILDYLPKK